MKKVFVDTKTREITNTEKQTPLSPCWAIVNTGTATMYINNNYKLLPGGVFQGGMNSDAVALLLVRGIVVENISSFNILFTDATAVVNEPGKFEAAVTKTQGRANIIETFVTYK